MSAPRRIGLLIALVWLLIAPRIWTDFLSEIPVLAAVRNLIDDSICRDVCQHHRHFAPFDEVDNNQGRYCRAPHVASPAARARDVIVMRASSTSRAAESQSEPQCALFHRLL